MHDFKGIEISKDEILEVAEKNFQDRNRLIIINGYINTEKQNVVAYNFDINGDVITYLVKGENELPSLTEIYGESARWAEEEIEELMPVKFTNLNRSRRLILPEDFKEGEGQILVMTLSELNKLKNNKEGEAN